jgi:hypothetical protein
MPNTLLTPTMVTREALRILHQKLNFIGNITRDSDSAYAKTGAKIGDSLKIRLPNQYTVRTGATLTTQDTLESSVTLQVATQKGVDVTFSSAELTLSLDDFSQRILRPAMAVLAANVEADALIMYRDVSNWEKSGDAVLMKFLTALNARKRLQDNLAPPEDRQVVLNTQHNVDLVNELKGLFQDASEIATQYRDGLIGRTAGFDWYENTLMPSHASSAATGYVVGGAGQTGAVLNVTTGTGTPNPGDVFTIAGVFRVHPESKLSTGILQQFAILPGSTTTVWNISPAIVTTLGGQNVSGSPGAGAVITFLQTASTTASQSLAFQEGAFAFATADLQMPDGVDFASRQVMDGISMRIVRQYAIASDTFPCRIDILYGYKTIRPQLACRMVTQV